MRDTGTAGLRTAVALALLLVFIAMNLKPTNVARQ